jgi:hypothetical protein
MHPDVHRYLDGELSRSALSAEAAAELAEWERLDQRIAQRRALTAPASLADDVMRALPATQPAPHVAATQPSAWRRAWGWLVTPRPIAVPPFAPLAAAMVIALLLLLPGTPWQQPAGPDMDAALRLSADEDDAPVIYVQFALRAADAQSVAVAGDFNEWSPDGGVLRDAAGDGVWRGLIAVRPGVHKYMFVVNGNEWVTDPVAESYIDDGFGMRNALLAVAAPTEEPS